jgi:excisionase family DNA binding protein
VNSIDAARLVCLLIKSRVGVQVKQSYEVEELDEDFFELPSASIPKGWKLSNISSSVDVKEPAMTTTDFSAKHTYVPTLESSAEVGDFARIVEGLKSPEVPPPKLVGPDGTEIAIPHDVFDALVYVAQALSAGKGVTLAPTDSQLTTQQAADYLGISRPTFIKLLEGGHIPFTTVGRHRRVMLADIAAYDQLTRSERRAALAEMSRDAMADGVFESTKVPDYEMR